MHLFTVLCVLGTRTVYPGKRNKGLSSTFQPPEEGQSVQRPKRSDKHGDKDEDNSPKNVNKFLIFLYKFHYSILSKTCFIEIIIIIIMSHRQHGYPWPSLVTSPYRSSPLAGVQRYIPYPHIAAVCMFELVVLLLPGHMWGSIGVHHLWACPCFSSSVLHVWFI